ncbi:hypothetical protein [Sphingomonas sp.]|uniref:hypothetical protein n=1 Tax=Sphingomonas sp. TaxID=28214 RepID=UPI003CC57B4F
MIAILRADGTLAAQVHVGDGQSAAAAGFNPTGLRERVVERFGRPGERLNPATGAWVADAAAQAAAIDAAYLADHGVDAIARAHAAKEAEARCIIAGVAIDGRVAAEAELRGVTAEVLARLIVAKADAAAAAEFTRIQAKLGQ